MSRIFFRTWHRRLGLMSFVVVIWLAFSGILINHSDYFDFNKRSIHSDWFNDLYGIKLQVPEAYLLNQHYIYCSSGHLYVDNQMLSACSSPDLKILEFKNYVLVLEKQALFVLSEEGLLLDELVFSLIGKYPESIWLENDMVILEGNGNEGMEQWRLDLEALELFSESGHEANMQKEVVEKIALPEKYIAYLPRDGVSIERILLDAHSGRLFGIAGVYVMDAFAVFFVLISLSGFYLFMRQQRSSHS